MGSHLMGFRGVDRDVQADVAELLARYAAGIDRRAAVVSQGMARIYQVEDEARR